MKTSFDCVILYFQSQDEGIYKCVATNEAGTSEGVAVLTVRSKYDRVAVLTVRSRCERVAILTVRSKYERVACTHCEE